jgi:hypothetical protein
MSLFKHEKNQRARGESTRKGDRVDKKREERSSQARRRGNFSMGEMRSPLAVSIPNFTKKHLRTPCSLPIAASSGVLFSSSTHLSV